MYKMDTNRLKKLLLPLVLEQLLAVSVGFIDTFMVSKVGEAAISGVALVDTINLLIMQIMVAFSAGGIVIISQYIGDKNGISYLLRFNSGKWLTKKAV